MNVDRGYLSVLRLNSCDSLKFVWPPSLNIGGAMLGTITWCSSSLGAFLGIFTLESVDSSIWATVTMAMLQQLYLEPLSVQDSAFPKRWDLPTVLDSLLVAHTTHRYCSLYSCHLPMSSAFHYHPKVWNIMGLAFSFFRHFKIVVGFDFPKVHLSHQFSGLR